MKVTPGRKVYCIYGDAILVEEVYAVGRDFFLLNPYNKRKDSWEWDFDAFDVTWFTSFKKAKLELLARTRRANSNLADYELVKVAEDYYEVRLKA